MRSDGRVVIACVLVAAAAPAQTLVERVVAVVDGRPLLLGDTTVLARVRGLAPAAAREALIDEHLMLREAARLGEAATGAADEERAFAALRTEPLLADVPDPALRRLVRRQTTILRYVALRFAPQVRIGEEELRSSFARTRPGETMTAEAASEERERLIRAVLDARVEAWVTELRKAADIRLLGDVEQAQEP